jgi:hypothetical protein
MAEYQSKNKNSTKYGESTEKFVNYKKNKTKKIKNSIIPAVGSA